MQNSVDCHALNMTIIIFFSGCLCYTEKKQGLGGKSMNHLVTKLVLSGLCFFPAVFVIPLQEIVIPALYSTVVALVSEYKPALKLKICCFVLWFLGSLFFPELLFFLPLFVYDLFPAKICVVNVLPITLLFVQDAVSSIGVAFLSAVALGAKYGVTRYLELKKHDRQIRDSLAESTLSLEKRLAHIRSEQDSKIMLATLSERNRIAREIHDNIGHLLSSAILQIGAMLSVTKDQQTQNGLISIRDTLMEGMENIRKSVHNLRDDSVDLKLELESILKEFTFCETELVYNTNRLLPVRQRYAVLGIVKEALSNVMRHSNATLVSVTLQSHPGLNQLIIRDNGSICSADFERTTGMGLESIRQRVLEMNGICDFGFQNGFRVFISWKPTGAEGTE